MKQKLMKLRRSGFGLPPTIPSPHTRPFLFRWPLFRSSWKFTSSPLRPDGREAFVRIYRRKIGSYKIVQCLLCFYHIFAFRAADNRQDFVQENQSKYFG